MPTKCEDRAAASAAIDDELKLLMSRIHELRARRNSLAPITVLPTEILTEIFSLLDCFPRATVLLVCRHWYTVARGAKLLWSRVHLDDWNLPLLRLAETMSANRIVSLEIGDWRSHLDKIGCRLLARISPHLESLTIECTTAAFHHLTAHLSTLDFSPPSLKCLALTRFLPGNDDDDDLERLHDLDIGMSGLHSISLSRVCVTRSRWLSVGGLRHLHLSHTYPLDLNVLLTVLKASPSLCSLRLDNPISRYEDDEPPDETVHLGSLEEFVVEDDPDLCALLLRYLSIPLTAWVSIRTSSDSPAAPFDLHGILGFARKHLQAADAPAGDTLRVHMAPYSGRCHFEIYNSITKQTLFLLDVYVEPAAESTTLRVILDVLTAPGHTHLELDGLCDMPETQWNQFIARIAPPVTLTVDVDERTGAVLQAICSAAPASLSVLQTLRLKLPTHLRIRRRLWETTIIPALTALLLCHSSCCGQPLDRVTLEINALGKEQLEPMFRHGNNGTGVGELVHELEWVLS
ncbi:hypothetical protein C8F01DRAFT_1147446 [Mycena amicta]|nr:hypothetical protein C8F01DRAFT_1147446 [Mycena amicta]